MLTALVALVVAGEPAPADLAARVRLDADVADAPVTWVVGPIAPARWRAILDGVRGGDGLVVVLDRDGPDWAALGLRALGVTTAPGPVASRCAGTPLCDGVDWRSAPPVGARTRLLADASWRVLAASDGAPLLLERALGRGRVFVLAAHAGAPDNERLRLWPYFNYLLRVLTAAAAGRDAPRYGDWRHAPVPHRGVALALAAIVAVLWVVTLAAFRWARRQARRHPDLPATLLPPPAPGAAQRWRRVGFARPLAGFLTLVGALVVLLAPYLWLNNVLIPNHVQPFPEAKGAWELTWEALQIVRFLFDAGTFVAFVKYFAEYRVRDPAEAVRCAQVFVWWQALTGLAQLTLAVAASTTALLDTRYAYTSYLVLLNGLVEYPGVFGLFTFFFMAYQRYDYNIGLDLLADYVLRHAVGIPMILLGRAWGRAHPEFGEVLGAALGIGVGYSVANLAAFGLGLALYRRLGLRLAPLFGAHFSRATLGRMLRYGLKLVLGQAAFRAAATVEILVVQALLLNYTHWLGIRGQIEWQLAFLLPIAYRFFEAATAALSESLGNGKRALSQYYLCRFLQLGAFWSALVASFLLALGPTFVRRGMDAQWHAVAAFLPIAVGAKLLGPFAWTSDMLQKAGGRPGLFAWLLAGEQASRIALAAALMPLFQLRGLYLAILLTLTAKVAVGWTLNHRWIVPLRVYAWPMFVAPALAGVANFALWWAVAGLLPDGAAAGRLAPAALFFAGGVLSFATMPFLLGLCGGIDAALAAELAEAADLAGAVRPIARVIAACARRGAAWSPLSAWAGVDIADEARREAAALERGS